MAAQELWATTQVARELGVPEWRLHDLVRRGEARPVIVAGRRLWSLDDVELAQRLLAERGVLPVGRGR